MVKLYTLRESFSFWSFTTSPMPTATAYGLYTRTQAHVYTQTHTYMYIHVQHTHTHTHTVSLTWGGESECERDTVSGTQPSLQQARACLNSHGSAAVCSYRSNHVTRALS